MRQVKRLSAVLLALIVVMAMSVTTFAAAGEYTVTLTPNADDHGTHTYEAYQVFKGDLSEKEGKKVLSNIKWGDGVDGAALLTELKTTQFSGGEVFAACTDAASVADVLKGFGDDAEDTQLFADVVGKHLSTTKSGTYENNKISNLAAGYYLVKDQDGSQDSREDAAYTRFILEVVSDVTANVKSEVPSVDKRIKEGEQKLSANSASIGDEINYEVTSKVPDMTGYNKYYFVLNDTMSKGLTFNNDVTVKIGTATLDSDAYTVTYETDAETGETAIKIVLNDFIQYKDQKDAAITVNYTATLNEQADLTATGNVNEVKLTYSNNPNHDYTGENEPGPKEPVGETPESTVKTFSTAVKLTKVDASEPTKTLAGAKFSISGEKLNVALINSEVWEKADDGTYYMLTDGTYTTTAPTDETKGNYDSTTQKYKKVEKVTKNVTKEQVNAEGYVDANGVLTFEGLNAGTYTIEELVAPNGYNLLKQPVTLVITGALDDTAKTCTWSAKVNGSDATINNNVIEFTVQNNQGTELPSTGGMGTTIFYIGGGLLVLIAGVMLVARRRASAK